jgi:hypothetical protein
LRNEKNVKNAWELGIAIDNREIRLKHPKDTGLGRRQGNEGHGGFFCQVISRVEREVERVGGTVRGGGYRRWVVPCFVRPIFFFLSIKRKGLVRLDAGAGTDTGKYL